MWTDKYKCTFFKHDLINAQLENMFWQMHFYTLLNFLNVVCFHVKHYRNYSLKMWSDKFTLDIFLEMVIDKYTSFTTSWKFDLVETLDISCCKYGFNLCIKCGMCLEPLSFLLLQRLWNYVCYYFIVFINNHLSR